jgi:hypothetical protein
MAHNLRETNRRPSPPEIPDDYQLTAEWRTGPVSAIVGIEVWGRRSRRDALIRIHDERGSLDAGAVTAGGTDDVVVTWTDQARAEYAEDWLDSQAATVVKALANRWGAV